MLEYLITSKTKRNLLKILFTNPDREFYIREISRYTGEPLNAVRRELGYLKKAGLVTSRDTGNLKYYSVVKDSPIYPELKKIIYTTVALGDYLRKRISDMEPIELAFIYGSVARDEEKASSDIDLFVVGEVDEGELHEVVSQIENDIGRSVNYVLMDITEFGKRLKNREPFVRRAMEEKKLVLKGNPDVYR